MNLNGVDLNKLRIFCLVIEQKGYRGAAEQTGFTRSAISQAITTLEAQLGKPLFHRMGTRMVATEDANRFYGQAMRYQLGLEAALSELQNKGTSLVEPLRIGAYLEFTKSQLMPAVERFLLNYPEAQIRFVFDSPSRLQELLERGRIDLAISIYPHRDTKIRSRKLFEEELCLVGQKDLVPSTPTFAELTRLPVIDYFPSHILFKRWLTLHFPRASVTRFSIRAFAANAEMVLEMVSRRLGIGVIPRYLLIKRGISDSITIIQPTPRKLIDYLWVNQRLPKSGSRIEEAFLNSIEQVL